MAKVPSIKNYNQDSSISKHPFCDPNSYRTVDGTEYIFERSTVSESIINIGSYKVRFQCGLKDNRKVISLEMEDFGWYYPMAMDIPEELKTWFSEEVSPNFLALTAIELIEEFKEFKKEMEEVAE